MRDLEYYKKIEKAAKEWWEENKDSFVSGDTTCPCCWEYKYPEFIKIILDEEWKERVAEIEKHIQAGKEIEDAENKSKRLSNRRKLGKRRSRSR